MKKIVTGLVLFFGALWGGAYVLYVLGTSNWMHFPAYMTAGVAGVIGVVSVASGCADVTTKRFN